MSVERVARFSLGALAVHLGLWALFAWVTTHHDVRKMDAKWLAGPVAAEVLVAGDSHARFAVEAPLLGRAVNLAVPGEHYLKTMYRVPWLLDHGTREVGAVLLPFDSTSFSSFKSDSYEPEAVWGQYVDWRELAVRRRAPLLYGGKLLKAVAFPYVGEGDSVFQFLTRSRHFRDPEAIGGWMPPDLEDGQEAAARHFAGAEPWDPDQAWGLTRLVEALRARGVHVVLVRYPLTAAYVAAARAYGADDGTRRDALFAQLSADGGVEQLDFERVFFGRDELFSDGDHLNAEGKRAFTALLARELFQRGLVAAPRWEVLKRPVRR
jgi:hypothetical protein